MDINLLEPEHKDPDRQPTELLMAVKLANAIKAKKLNRYQIRLELWAVEFKRLLAKRDRSEVWKVLDWYIDNLGQEYVPDAFSAESFRKKYERIEVSMCSDPDAVEVSKEGESILNLLKQTWWPKGADIELPVVVQKSFGNYSKFLDSLKKLKAFVNERQAKCPDEEDKMAVKYRRLHLFLNHLFTTGKVQNPIPFVTNWFLMINNSVVSWPAWEGGLGRYIWKATSPRFQQIARNWSAEWARDSRLWDMVEEMLKDKIYDT